jgi:hypothetical protein
MPCQEFEKMFYPIYTWLAWILPFGAMEKLKSKKQKTKPTLKLKPYIFKTLKL